MPEHTDYHFALELSKLDNTTATSRTSSDNPILKKPNSNKRVNSEQTENTKITNKKQKKNEQPSNLKKIENYFKKA